jgi:ubiquinol-cytochrome c reductase cytochrome c subunit
MRAQRRVGGAAAAISLILLIAAALALAEPPSGVVHVPGGSEMPLSRLGAGLFAANCASCHGIAGQGVAEPNPRAAGGIVGQGPPLIGVGALAPDFYLRTGRMPLRHAGEQPERQPPVFNDREIRALVAYVASFGGGPPIPTPHPDPSRLSEGMSLFTEHCAGCHQVVGEGGYVTGARVPPLEDATATQIAEAVRIGPFLMPRFPKSQIDDRELDAIVAYVEASRSPEDRGGLGIGHIGPVPEGIVAWLVAGVVLVGVCVLIGTRLKT